MQPIHQKVVSHFTSHFRAWSVVHLSVGNLQFQRLSVLESGGLIKPFFLEEVKMVV